MNKILLVLKREYLTRVKKKSFIIITLLVPLGFLMMVMFQVWLMTYSSETMRLVVKDDSELFAHRFKDSESLYFKKSSQSLDELRANYIENDFDGILYIPKLDINNPQGVKYISENLLGLSTKKHIEREIADEIKKMRLTEMGIDTKIYNKLEHISVEVKEESGEGADIGSTGVATGIGYMMGVLMYMVIFIYGSMVMRGVMEEKTNRIVEVILSSLRPFKLMMGKILGIGLVGITQFSIWIILFLGINIVIGLVLGGTMDMPTSGYGASEADMEQAMEMMELFQARFQELPLTLLICSFLFYFVGGYILYAAMFAALASAVNDESDAQTLTIPVSIPVIISFFILTAIIEAPNSSLAVWSSIIPLFSPIIMPSRIAFGVPPLWELLLSMVMLVLGCIFAVWIAAKIYRIGILMYGKKVTFKEIGKWLRY